MREEKFFHYLVLGGEHHGYSFNAPFTRNLEVRSNDVPMAKLYHRDEPAETIKPQLVTYKVYEHIREDRKHFFIATNDDLTNFDVDAEILKSKISPVN
ncbi:hypothetical protein KW823_05360 [Enterobacter quasiroggenkampii]|nr:hypothetical protein [Enterobacter quasiroggenkampii]